MAAHAWVKHSETGETWQCPNDYLPVARARGWEDSEAPEADDSHLHDPKPARKAAAPKKSGD